MPRIILTYWRVKLANPNVEDTIANFVLRSSKAAVPINHSYKLSILKSFTFQLQTGSILTLEGARLLHMKKKQDKS